MSILLARVKTGTSDQIVETSLQSHYISAAPETLSNNLAVRGKQCEGRPHVPYSRLIAPESVTWPAHSIVHASSRDSVNKGVVFRSFVCACKLVGKLDSTWSQSRDVTDQFEGEALGLHALDAR